MVKNEDLLENVYTININPPKAPDCRFCIFYWNNRRDRNALQDGFWQETTYFDETGEEEHFERITTFKHGCKKFKIIVPNEQLPSSYIYRTIGKHCPLVCEYLKEMGKIKKDSKIEYIKEEHNIDIII
jgi:hypothetical protein